METITISTEYKLKWQFKKHNYIKIATDKTIINCRTGRILKLTLNGSSKGVWIGEKFITLSKLNNHIELIKEVKCPF